MKQMRTSVKVPKTAYQGMLSKEVKDIIMKNAYLGKKGYTIPKACIQKEDYDLIKQDLIMTPFTMGGYGKPQNTSFPIFRENSAKLYVPRFYGIQEFGMPAKSEIQTGETHRPGFFKRPARLSNKSSKHLFGLCEPSYM